MSGVIFDIKHFAIHDGPGIRTTVFVKGCPLHCKWCHNPESYSFDPQLLFDAAKCIGCGSCLNVCPTGAHVTQDDTHVLLWDRCNSCGECASECYSNALEMVGRKVSVSDVLDEVLRDNIVYRNSGGGLTISGGEPMAQPLFTGSLLEQAQRNGIYTALDTSGYIEWDKLRSVLQYTDLVLYDLKHMDSDTHERLTGVRNEIILKNLTSIDKLGKPIWIRVPLIPSQNDDEENYHRLGDFLSKLKNIERVDILRYHRLAESKYEKAGMKYSLTGLETPKKTEVDPLKEILEDYGLTNIVVS